MRFEKIRICGFKGFADPVELTIEDGLNGVVGPNGCGKSNLVEAVGWVMGENRPTVLRADSMEDVIFNGTSARPSRSFAEVVLEVRDGKETMPSDSSASSAIEISRKIGRDGGSIFRKNGSEVRWRDIQLLFADAATGARSSALVRQGQISELVNASPLGRSTILENAAGISGLNQRRHEAELKLDSTEHNLLRVADLIHQLKTSIATLERHARQARRFKNIAEKLRYFEKLLALLNWKQANAQAIKAETKLAQCLGKLAELETIHFQAECKRNKCNEEHAPLHENATMTAAALQRAKLEYGRIEEKVRTARNTITSLFAHLSQIDKDLVRERYLEQDALRSITNLEKQLANHQGSMSTIDLQISIAKVAFEYALSDLADNEKKFERLNFDLIRIETTRHKAVETARTRESEIKHLRKLEVKAVDEIECVMEKCKLSKVKLQKSLKVQEDSLQAKQKFQEEYKKAEENRSRQLALLENANGYSASIASRLHALASEVEQLSKLLETGEKADSKHSWNIKVSPGYEKAVGAAFGDDLFFTKTGNNSRNGWVTLSSDEPEISIPEGSLALGTYVDAPDYLKRRLYMVGLTCRENAPEMQIKLLPGQRIVTLEGDLFRWDGLRIAEDKMQSTAAIRLAQINRLTHLEKQISDAKVKADEAAKASSSAKKEFDDIAETCRKTRYDWHEAERKLADAKGQLSQAKAEVAIGERDLNTFNNNLVQLRSKITEMDLELTTSCQLIESIGNIDAKRNEMESARQKMDAARSVSLDKRTQYEELQREVSKHNSQVKEISQGIANWRHRKEEADRRINELKFRRKHCASEHNSALKAPGRLVQRKDALQKEITRLEQSSKDVADELALKEAAYRKIENESRVALQRVQEQRELRARMEVHSENAQAKVEDLLRSISDCYNTNPDQLASTIEISDLHVDNIGDIEHKIEKLKRQRETIGAVNLRAEQDMLKLQEDLESISREHEELANAVQKIRVSIAQLNKEGKSRLNDAFEKVRVHFRVLFTSLFEGGSADLELLKSDDPLQNGLEIHCHPPGKRQTTLSLMSGGEQTLTSIALIFAFFLTNPAPLCVLDEVDSSLDDSNILRLCNLLDSVVKKTGTRFLIVTHNAITMSRMDRLFGVTMQEKGVSQLVRVDLGEAEKLAA